MRFTKDIQFETEDGNNAQKKTQSERFSVHAWLWLTVYGACSKVAVGARLTVGKKNAARLVLLEEFRSRRRSRNISCVCAYKCGGPKHTLMCSWCALGDDCYLFFVGKGVLCCRRLASCTYSRRCNGVAFNTENTLFRSPINRQSCGVTTEIRFYTK